jgi:glucosamine--fructose-6-phosphate aminotransferase (isomerizing)
MCGVFGFITREGKGPDITRLRNLALITQSRGMHAFGLAWITSAGTIRSFKSPGPAQRYLDELERCRDAVIVIGHCRYATHGTPLNNANNHPHPAGNGYLVHNGVIFNHQELVRRYRLRRRSSCDSEVLGLLMARGSGSLAQRSAWAASHAEGDLAILGLWRAPARLLVARRGKPLCFGPGSDGYYFASLPTGLPGKVQEIADGSTRVLTYANGNLRLEGQVLELGPGGELFDQFDTA